MSDHEPTRSDRRGATAAKAFALVAAGATVLLVGLGAFPWGVLRGAAEEALTKEIGQPVTITAMTRREPWSLTPTVELNGVNAPAPDWAGGGELFRIETARFRIPVFSILTGAPRIDSVEIDGMAISLTRDENGRKSWLRDDPPDDAENPGEPGRGLRRLVVRNATVSYDDRLQDRKARVRVTADERSGVRIEGEGDVHGEPVSILAVGAPVIPASVQKPWPFRAEIAGEAVGVIFDGEMAAPLTLGWFRANARAHGEDLALIDAIIEAGLLETQPLKLEATVERHAPDWTITDLSGVVGRSDIRGQATIVKRKGRTRIEGEIAAGKFDFDDLANDEGRRIAAEKRARLGPRLFPDTAINLDSVDTTDGRLNISAEELLWSGHSPFRTLKGVLSVENKRLTVDELEVGMTNGAMTGDVSVDHREGKPTLDLDLTVSDSRLIDLFPDAGVDGAFRARLALVGDGETVREAIGASTGSVALVGRNGAIPAKTASLLGQDVGRGLTTGDEKLATLNCLVARFDVDNGEARAAPVVIDTSRARTQARGRIDFADESLALILNGAPKQNSVLRFEGDVPVGGVIKKADISLPDGADSVGGVLKMIGEAIIGDQDPIADDADCESLAARALD